MIIISKKETGGIVPPLRFGWQKTHRQHLDYDPERVKINIAVAVKPVFKYQGLRSLPWGVRRSLLRRIPGFGSANLLRQTATVFFCAPISARPIPLIPFSPTPPSVTSSSPNASSGVPRPGWFEINAAHR